MILPDINLLLHAYNSDSPVHGAARRWWEDRLTEGSPVHLPWVVLLGFLRLATHRQIAANPLPVSAACEIVESWLTRSQVSVLHPGDRHPAILFGFLRSTGAGGNMMPLRLADMPRGPTLKQGAWQSCLRCHFHEQQRARLSMSLS